MYVMLIGVGLAAASMYVIAKTLTKPEKLMDTFDYFLNELTQNVEMQKKVYVLGILLGQGIASGAGLKGKGGKFKLDDIVGQGIGMFIEKMLGGKEVEHKRPFIEETA